MHSTETSLINFSDNLQKAIDKKLASLLVLLDMSKAFDSLNHNLLLQKLRKTWPQRFSSFLVQQLPIQQISRLGFNGLAPDYLIKYFVKRSAVHNRNTRGCNSFVVPRCRLSTGQRGFYYPGPREWNGLAEYIKNV